MDIENNRYLFYVCVGLTASGSDGYDRNDSDILTLASQIHAAELSDDIKSWFARARTGQVEVNPYWPRGSALAVACFFMDDGYKFNADLFFSFIESIGGMSDPIGKEDFQEWILELPDILRGLDAHPETDSLWKEYCHIVGMRSPEWQGMVEKAVSAARMFFGNNIPKMVFNPNLFTPYSADFVRVGNRIVTISAVPDAETMLHETMHTAVSKYREELITFAETYGLGAFADQDKMTEFGYMKDDTAASAAHVIEECFVRALAVTFSGGSEERLQFHAKYGCNSVPLIASHIRRMKPSVLTLNELICCVLDEMKKNRSN